MPMELMLLSSPCLIYYQDDQILNFQKIHQLMSYKKELAKAIPSNYFGKNYYLY